MHLMSPYVITVPHLGTAPVTFINTYYLDITTYYKFWFNMLRTKI